MGHSFRMSPEISVSDMHALSVVGPVNMVGHQTCDYLTLCGRSNQGTKSVDIELIKGR